MEVQQVDIQKAFHGTEKMMKALHKDEQMKKKKKKKRRRRRRRRRRRSTS
jgi:hypothetical protein